MSVMSAPDCDGISANVPLRTASISSGSKSTVFVSMTTYPPGSYVSSAAARCFMQ